MGDSQDIGDDDSDELVDDSHDVGDDDSDELVGDSQDVGDDEGVGDFDVDFDETTASYSTVI